MKCGNEQFTMYFACACYPQMSIGHGCAEKDMRVIQIEHSRKVECLYIVRRHPGVMRRQF